MVGGISIIVINSDALMPAVNLIFSDAFSAKAVAGGAIGTVIRYGVARGVFSNEAGMGSAPIAAAAAKTDHPVRQALVSMTGTFFGHHRRLFDYRYHFGDGPARRRRRVCQT